ncbi:ubiquitin carboxyl-terminal hydrolase 20-like isoform X1 [Mya arenaria]|uniref:ubiquitin carboxyl-terminal hydrolase 20-like isoform X1 n=1 Tax=Mya arenaria TaxID=6604 RepID=UPI0022DFA201|nr:ubiquitin carboxyl-terminal hydrolase 20-like isoform X1 [Mya arenaria]
MASKISRCAHVSSIGRISWEEIKKAQTTEHCDSCESKEKNLWLCLIGSCSYIGCGESGKDHSSQHAESHSHCLSINLSTLRIWCYRCESEVFHDKNSPAFMIPDKPSTLEEEMDVQGEITAENSPHHSVFGFEDSESEPDEDIGMHNVKPKGLTGLQNLGNTCYLNAALQALSNCPPLTRYFLDCPGFVHPDKSPRISTSYMKLMNEIWHRKRPSYMVPSSVVSGIKLVHPMFRGYAQQDTQEFLRCFMDQLHEELKQPIKDNHEDREEESNIHEHKSSPVIGQIKKDGQIPMDTSSTSSQSDCDYETCDSALGSEKDSVSQNGFSDEDQGNELAHLNISSNSRELRSQKKTSNSFSSESGISRSDDFSNRTSKLKEKKDHANRSIRSAENVSIGNDDQRSDSGEFVDAESEPARGRVRGRRRVSGSSERGEGLGNRSKARQKSGSSYTTHSGPGKNVQYRSVISDIFDGKLNSSVQCLTCERVSTTKETFQDLSLPIPSKDHVHMLHASTSHVAGQKLKACSEVHQSWLHWMYGYLRSWFMGPMVNLQDCLAAFFSADELKGDNMYSCEKCKKLRNGLKYSKVLELPEVLCIHLKRFRHEFYSSKISTYVSFPLTNLDMKPYLHKDHTSQVTVYDLVAVICHHGTAGGGHYTAYCQNVFTELWYEFDDQYVTEVDVSQVVNCEAYVLFYRKRNDHMHSVRQEAMDLMNNREPSLMHFFVSKQWINRFNTFAEPGPITNDDFLCPHGGVPPQRLEFIGDLVEPLSQSMWEYLHDRFGGGPACNHLFPCGQCHKQLEMLRNRQKKELDEFIKPRVPRNRQKTELKKFIQLNERFKEEDNPSVIYAISMTWFKEWENFVREKEDQPPDSIDNKRISVVKNGQLVVRHNSDHGQLSGEMWEFLYNIYGGGPELIIKQVTPPPVAAHSKTLAEQAMSAHANRSENANTERGDTSSRSGDTRQSGKGELSNESVERVKDLDGGSSDLGERSTEVEETQACLQKEDSERIEDDMDTETARLTYDNQEMEVFITDKENSC